MTKAKGIYDTVKFTPELMDKIIEDYAAWKLSNPTDGVYTIDITQNYYCPLRIAKECCTTKMKNNAMCIKCHHAYSYKYNKQNPKNKPANLAI